MQTSLKARMAKHTGPFIFMLTWTRMGWCDDLHDGSVEALLRSLCKDDCGANFHAIIIRNCRLSHRTLAQALEYARLTPACTTLRLPSCVLNVRFCVLGFNADRRQFPNAVALGQALASSYLRVFQLQTRPFPNCGWSPTGAMTPSEGCDLFLNTFITTLEAKKRIHPLRELHIATDSPALIVRLLTSPQLPYLRILNVPGYQGDRQPIAAAVEGNTNIARLVLDWEGRPTTPEAEEVRMYRQVDDNNAKEKALSQAIAPACILARSTSVPAQSKNLTNLANLPIEIKVAILECSVGAEPLSTDHAYRLFKFAKTKNAVEGRPPVRPSTEGTLPHSLADWCRAVLCYKEETVEEAPSQ